MHKTNQTKNFKRQPGDLHRWRPASLFSLAVIIMLVYQCRRLISGCLLIRRLLILIVLLVLLLLIIIIIINVFLIILFFFLSNYSDESMRTLRA